MADTQPPRRVLKPVTEEDAPNNLPNHGLTPANGIVPPTLVPTYVRGVVGEAVREVTRQIQQVNEATAEEAEADRKGSTRKTFVGGSIIGLLTVALTFISDCRHEAKDTQEKGSLRKDFETHVAAEKTHHDEVMTQLNLLLKHELEGGKK